METTIYLVRHAQSHPSHDVPHNEWPLSETGISQAGRLGEHLSHLGIRKIVSSPFVRCLETIRPFAELKGLEVDVHEGLRERLVAFGTPDKHHDIWIRSWEDFSFKLPECECSNSAQSRFVSAMHEVAERHSGETIAVSSHGFVIALFLNHLDRKFHRAEAEKIRNPDVIRVIYSEGAFNWDRAFSIHALHDFATDHKSTPIKATAAAKL